MRPTARLLVLLSLAALPLLLVAAPAWADPAGPTHYRAEVTGIEPPTRAVDAEVHGGDSYLVLRAARGAGEIVVPGYDGEEAYLRFDPDGRVYENQASATYFQNLDRYGAPVPADAGADAPPRWVQVSDDGTFAWHDHRIHWMSPSPPPQVDTASGQVQPVYDWEVPLLVDGEHVTVAGELTWYPTPAPVLALLVGLLTLVAGVVVVRRSSVTATVVVALLAGVLALAIVVSGRVGLPTGVQAEPALLPPAIIAVAAPALALAGRKRPAGERLGLAGLGTLTALLVVVLQGGALTRPVVPNLLPGVAVRGILAAVVGLGTAVLVGVVRGFVRDLGGGEGSATARPPAA